MIPKTIHQTWKDRDVPERFRAAQHGIDALPRAFRTWGKIWPRHVRVLTTTGPLFLTGRLREFGVRDDMRILSLDEHGHGDPALSYVGHLRGDTWAAWDTHVIHYLYDNWRWMTAVGVGARAYVLSRVV